MTSTFCPKPTKTPCFLRFARTAGFGVSKAKSKIEKTASAVLVGIGLLALPFLIQANDGEKTNDAPEVGCLWIANFVSIGFKVQFDITKPSDGKEFHKFRLEQDGSIVNDEYAPSATLELDYCGWLEIPGFDGGPPLPYPGYSHSFDFTVKALKTVDLQLIPLDGSPPLVGFIKWETFWVDISLYVTVNSNGLLRSMSAYAYDNDGDFYEVPLYYSPGGSENFRAFED